MSLSSEDLQHRVEGKDSTVSQSINGSCEVLWRTKPRPFDRASSQGVGDAGLGWVEHLRYSGGHPWKGGIWSKTWMTRRYRHVRIWKVPHSRQRGQPVQRSWGRNELKGCSKDRKRWAGCRCFSGLPWGTLALPNAGLSGFSLCLYSALCDIYYST